jgi:hypothetical protein
VWPDPSGKPIPKGLFKDQVTNKLVLGIGFAAKTESSPEELKQIVDNLLGIAELTGKLLQKTVQPGVGNRNQAAAEPSLAGTTWTGKEKVGGLDCNLSFEFQANGKVSVNKGSLSFQGTYTQKGSQVTVVLRTYEFSGVMVDVTPTTYQGTINGNAFTGQGQDSAGTWTFNVTKK